METIDRQIKRKHTSFEQLMHSIYVWMNIRNETKTKNLYLFTNGIEIFENEFKIQRKIKKKRKNYVLIFFLSEKNTI